MGALSISLGLAQTQNPETGDLRVFVDVSQDFAIPLPAESGNQSIWVMKPKAYKGFYSVQTQNLAGGPVNMLPPQIVRESETGPLGIAVHGLWAYDELGNVPVRSYRWQRNGVDIPGATEAQYMPVSADAGQTLQVVETATDARGARGLASNGVAITGTSDPFGVVLETGGLLRITGNDGRSFSVDDPAGIYDGTYSLPVGSLASGPGALVQTVLSGDGTPEVGETLAITPALFAYDPGSGGLTVTYTTNGTNQVDASDPDAPTLLIDAADAGRTLTVTATATQGANATNSVSNSVAVAVLPDPFEAKLETGGLLRITGNDGRSFSVDDPAGIYDGTYSLPVGSLASGPGALVQTVLSGDGTPEVGETLAITPALFAYDPGSGGLTVTYTTNGTNQVDASDPDAPTLLIDAADAGRTLTVTATATQGANATNSVSNSVAVAVLPDPFEAKLETGGLLRITGNDGRSFSVDDPAGIYDGTYSLPVGSLASGPGALVQTVLSGDGTPEVGETLAITPALFAYDSALGGVTVSYTTNGTNQVDASDPSAPALRIDAADAGRTLTVTATATQGANATNSVSNGIAVADPFEVVLETGGLLQITGNDGRSFSVDDPAGIYDGIYSVSVVALSAGPVALVQTVLSGDGTPEVGETLAITPPLFAYDSALGGVTVSYSTNGVSRVDASDPSAPKLLIDAADAGRTLTVTATVMQGTNDTSSVSNGVAVAVLPDPFEAKLETGGLLRITGNDGRSFSVDDAANHYDGTYSLPVGSLASGPAALVQTVLSGDGTPEVGETLAITPALFAYDSALGGLTVSYTTNGTNQVDTSDPSAPKLLIDAADAGRTLTVTATATQGVNATNSVSNGIAVADSFKVVLESDGTLQITGNDGRSFSVDDPVDIYDGTYSVSPSALASGPIALVQTVLAGDGTPEVGETLAITPALFAYDPGSGGLTVTYTTNGTNQVDASDPDAPTLLIDAADAGRTITVTATATQGANATNSVSNGVAITPGAVSAFDVAQIDLHAAAASATSIAFTVDLSKYVTGDKIYVVYGVGSDEAGAPSVSIDGVNMGPHISYAAGNFGARLLTYEHTLTANGRASSTIQVVFTVASVNNGIAVFGAKGATRNAIATDTTNATEVLSASVTPSGAKNALVAVVLGRVAMFTDRVWTTVSEVLFESPMGDTTNLAGAIAIARDTAVSSQTVTFTPNAAATANSANDAGMVVIAFSGA